MNNGAIDATKTTTATGVAYLDIKGLAKVHSSQFIDGQSASGGGISFMGLGYLEVQDCLFRGNTVTNWVSVLARNLILQLRRHARGLMASVLAVCRR